MVSKTMKKLNMTTQTGFDYGGIPPGIQKRGLFCLYRLELKTANAVKPDKVPYKQDGTRADPSNPADFCPFEEALAVYNSGGFDGIGIGCFAPIGMTDVDGCVHDGKLDEWAQEIVDEFDSYTELSPSGTGIHIFFLIEDFSYDKERYYINNRKTHVEVYVPGATHRFLTMTGQCIHGTEVMERTEQLKRVLEKYMVRPQAEAVKPAVTVPGSFLSDESVLRKMFAFRQMEKAKALWEGTIPDGKSHSEADMALAEILAFWCGGDIEQMDRLFRQSGLMRDKWDRPQSGSTYGILTLQKAVRNCTAFYSPVLTPAADDFNDIVMKLTELDLENNIVTIDHQLLRTSKMEYIIQSTKTNAGTRKLPITEDVAYCFRAIIEDRPTPKVEKFVDGYSGFLYLDKDGMPEVAMHWQHRFNHAVQRYNDIYRVQMPNITPHVCRHTYCSNMAKAGMNPKTLQYLMGHSDIGVTMNTYTHLGLEDAKDEMIRMEELNAARAELNKTTGEKPVTQKMFRAI